MRRRPDDRGRADRPAAARHATVHRCKPIASRRRAHNSPPARHNGSSPAGGSAAWPGDEFRLLSVRSRPGGLGGRADASTSIGDDIRRAADRRHTSVQQLRDQHNFLAVHKPSRGDRDR